MCQPTADDFAQAPAHTRFETEPNTKYQARRQAKPDILGDR
jgi:hypothetical protein